MVGSVRSRREMVLDFLRNCTGEFRSLWKVTSKTRLNMSIAKEIGKKLHSIGYVEMIKKSKRVKKSARALSTNPKCYSSYVIRITRDGKDFLNAEDDFIEMFPEFYGLGLDD